MTERFLSEDEFQNIRDDHVNRLKKVFRDSDTGWTSYGAFNYKLRAEHNNTHVIEYGDASLRIPAHPHRSGHDDYYVLQAIARGEYLENAVKTFKYADNTPVKETVERSHNLNELERMLEDGQLEKEHRPDLKKLLDEEF